MHTLSRRQSGGSCWATPATRAGWIAPIFAAAAIVLGVIGEVLRGEVDGPYYRVAFLVALATGAAAVVAVRGGERSIVTMLAIVPFLIVLSFGVAELVG